MKSRIYSSQRESKRVHDKSSLHSIGLFYWLADLWQLAIITNVSTLSYTQLYTYTSPHSSSSHQLAHMQSHIMIICRHFQDELSSLCSLPQVKAYSLSRVHNSLPMNSKALNLSSFFHSCSYTKENGGEVHFKSYFFFSFLRDGVFM